MTRIKFSLSLPFILLLASCGDSEPVATSYKKSMSAPQGAATSPTPAGTANGTAGDAAKGETALKGSCETAGCHAGSARVLNKNEATKFATPAEVTRISGLAVHGSVKTIITTQAADINAALKVRP